jgi:hypothetical protein
MRRAQSRSRLYIKDAPQAGGILVPGLQGMEVQYCQAVAATEAVVSAHSFESAFSLTSRELHVQLLNNVCHGTPC